MMTARRWRAATAATLLALIGVGPAIGQEQEKPKDEPQEKAAEAEARRPGMSLSPAIEVKATEPRDAGRDGLPHEGAMVDVPYIVEPPDLIRIEVLEALPGRPITGERLVQPNGMVNLEFYGDIHVRGLSVAQIKEKVIVHMRKFIPDATLGLVELDTSDNEATPTPLPPVPPKATPSPFAGPRAAQPLVRKSTFRQHAALERSPFDFSRTSTQTPGPVDVEAALRELPLETDPSLYPQAKGQGRVVTVAPADSDRVFVEVTAYNSKNYFVLGDVHAPGRLPITGNETVLDALNNAGGLQPIADPKAIRLVRPARGERPARAYSIDWQAILEGDAKANLQLLPGDRLIVGRNKVVEKTVEIARLNESVQALQYGAQYYASLLKILREAGLTDAQRDAVLARFVELYRTKALGPEGATFDEQALRDALMPPPAEGRRP